MFRDALYQEYRINVSGGNKNTRYSVSGGYLNQEGVVVTPASNVSQDELTSFRN